MEEPGTLPNLPEEQSEGVPPLIQSDPALKVPPLKKKMKLDLPKLGPVSILKIDRNLKLAVSFSLYERVVQ